MSDKKENKRRQRSLPTQMSLVIRIAAGIYLLYLTYSIYNAQTQMQGIERGVFIAVMVLFAAIGGTIIVTSLRALQRGEYVGGRADIGENKKKEAEENKKTEQKRIRFEEPMEIREKEEEE